MKHHVAVPLFALALAAACSHGPKTVDLSPNSPNETMKQAPNWYLNPPTDANFVLGPATATSSEMQLALDKAYLAGRNQIAQKLRTRLDGITKSFREETALGNDSELLDQFTQAYRGAVDVSLSNSRPRKGFQVMQQEGAIYRVYVLMEMPVSEVSKAVTVKVEQNVKLHTEVRATKAFQELMAEAKQASAEIKPPNN